MKNQGTISQSSASRFPEHGESLATRLPSSGTDSNRLCALISGVKVIIILTFFLLTHFVNAQIVYEYDLSQLAAKKYKSNPEFSISDHTFTALRTLSGVKIRFIGSGTKPLVFKNFKGQYKIELSATIKTNTSSPTLKLVDCQDPELDGLNSTKILGSGNSSGQLIDLSGKWTNPKIHGFYLDQGRDNKPGESKGGAMLQLHGIEDATFNHGKIYIWDIDGNNANDEFIYDGLYYSKNASRAKYIEIWNTRIRNSGRDFWQITNVDSVYIHDNVGDNGNLEQEPNHISGFSLNDGNRHVRLQRNRITNVPQFIYSGTIDGRLETFNNVYIQGKSAYVNNQAIYTKSNTFLSGDSIIAPKVLIAAIAQDKAQVTYSNLTIVAPEKFRYSTPIPVELPFVKSYPVQAIVKETTLNGVTKKVLVYENREFPIE